jgi:hypothetical protein
MWDRATDKSWALHREHMLAGINAFHDFTLERIEQARQRWCDED